MWRRPLVSSVGQSTGAAVVLFSSHLFLSCVSKKNQEMTGLRADPHWVVFEWNWYCAAESGAEYFVDLD